MHPDAEQMSDNIHFMYEYQVIENQLRFITIMINTFSIFDYIQIVHDVLVHAIRQ